MVTLIGIYTSEMFYFVMIYNSEDFIPKNQGKYIDDQLSLNCYSNPMLQTS